METLFQLVSKVAKSEFFRFGCVGFCVAFLTSIVLKVFVEDFGFNKDWSYAGLFFGSILLNFAINDLVTFRKYSDFRSRGAAVGFAGRGAVIAPIKLVSSYPVYLSVYWVYEFVMDIFRVDIHYQIVYWSGIGVGFCFNFLVAKFLVYRKKIKKDE